jgi:transposase-like protein
LRWLPEPPRLKERIHELILDARYEKVREDGVIRR